MVETGRNIMFSLYVIMLVLYMLYQKSQRDAKLYNFSAGGFSHMQCIRAKLIELSIGFKMIFPTALLRFDKCDPLN